MDKFTTSFWPILAFQRKTCETSNRLQCGITTRFHKFAVFSAVLSGNKRISSKTGNPSNPLFATAGGGYRRDSLYIRPSAYEADERLCYGLLPIATKYYGVCDCKCSLLKSIVAICY